jgi:hypothetical protein
MMLLYLALACHPPVDVGASDSDTTGVDPTDTAVSQFDTDEPSSGECLYDSRLGVCWRELTAAGPTWTETVTPMMQTGRCQPFIECDDESAAKFALIDHHGEYADYQYWDAEGAFVASVSNTDTVESDDPCDCLRAGISSWGGYPVSDCGGFNSSVVMLPGCPTVPALEDLGPLPQNGLVTGESSWDAAAGFRNQTCAAMGTCEGERTAVLRQTRDWQLGDGINGGGVDVFDSDGLLVGTAEFATGTSYGVVPPSCLAVADVTQGCGIVAVEPD